MKRVVRTLRASGCTSLPGEAACLARWTDRSSGFGSRSLSFGGGGSCWEAGRYPDLEPLEWSIQGRCVALRSSCGLAQLKNDVS